jgi:KUP system potassium uptake protein
MRLWVVQSNNITNPDPPPQRVPGTAIYFNRGKATTPLALRATVEHTQVLHEQVILFSIETLPVSHVPVTERLAVDHLNYPDDGITSLPPSVTWMTDRP